MKTSVAAVVGFISVGGTTVGTSGEGILAYSALACTPNDHAYTVTGSETWSTLAARFNLTQESLVRQNKRVSNKALHARQTICVPDTTQQHLLVSTKTVGVTEIAVHSSAQSARTTHTRARAVPAPQSTPTASAIGAQSTKAKPIFVSTSDTNRAALIQNAPMQMAPVVETSAMAPANEVGHYNPYPYPQCTWWADQRYHQTHGVFVPWTKNAMAWQWKARATDFGWHISSRPTVGSILVLQPGVQGAGTDGHVAIVERVQGNHVIASSTNWGTNPYTVTRVRFALGYGVTFIRR
ncbi:MAG TPA: CHAP domain-containing protein [Ktedonobacteraceae bacterium]|nr:CHAP domain-containing protein [Ktedonobacteraceae bacterium]